MTKAIKYFIVHPLSESSIGEDNNTNIQHLHKFGKILTTKTQDKPCVFLITLFQKRSRGIHLLFFHIYTKPIKEDKINGF